MTKAQAASAAPRHALRQRYPWLLPGGLVLLLIFLTINVLADGPLIPMDRRIHKIVHATANSAAWRWLKAGPASPARLLIDLANVRVAIPALIAIAVVVATRRGSWRPVLTAATGVVLLLGIVISAKILIGRPNPGHSHLPGHQLLGAFPSGHTTTACVCYLLAVVIIAPYPRGRRGRIALRAAAVLGFLVGIAMVWCNLHWFTDVVAGWALSALIIPLTIRLTGQRTGPGQGRQEQPTGPRALALSKDLGSG
jgi:undecaprenyl-diphosphatase